MTPAVEVRGLNYRYPDGAEALRSVHLSIEAGACIGLVGPNGAGKSTLLMHLNGLLPEDGTHRGNVLIGGEPIARGNLHAIRRRVGLLFQDPDDQLFCPTVFEDVAFGPRQFGADPRRLAEVVASALAKAGLEGFERRAPHRLSGGEKKRACLAAVLACEPEVLVLDEPTAALDPRGRREFKALLRSLPRTKLLATHDLDAVAELCDRVILLDAGRIVAAGPTRDLLGDAALMERHGLERPRALGERQIGRGG